MLMIGSKIVLIEANEIREGEDTLKHDIWPSLSHQLFFLRIHDTFFLRGQFISDYQLFVVILLNIHIIKSTYLNLKFVGFKFFLHFFYSFNFYFQLFNVRIKSDNLVYVLIFLFLMFVLDKNDFLFHIIFIFQHISYYH